MREVIAMIAIRKSRILLVRKEKVWILPGGKPQGGESDIQCLKRELGEELPQLQVSGFRFYRAFTGIAPHKGDTIKVRTYFANVSGEVTPGAEINATAWVNTKEMPEYKLSDATQKIVDSIKTEGYL